MCISKLVLVISPFWTNCLHLVQNVTMEMLAKDPSKSSLAEATAFTIIHKLGYICELITGSEDTFQQSLDFCVQVGAAKHAYTYPVLFLFLCCKS